MPGFDGTGPRGEGPMTGWGMGYCALPKEARGNYYPPAYISSPRFWGRGRWFKWMHGLWPGFGGWGRGLGFRGGYGW